MVYDEYVLTPARRKKRLAAHQPHQKKYGTTLAANPASAAGNSFGFTCQRSQSSGQNFHTIKPTTILATAGQARRLRVKKPTRNGTSSDTRPIAEDSVTRLWICRLANAICNA